MADAGNRRAPTPGIQVCRDEAILPPVKFVAPSGAQLREVLGAGSIFRVALVAFGSELCVCKRLRPRMLAEPLALQALEREAHVLGVAEHPGLPRLVARGADSHGPYLLQTRPDGVALTQLVEGLVGSRGAVPAALLDRVARRGFTMLAELHDLARLPGLVHGDLGPDHVLVSPTGEVAFIDFGQARWTQMPATLAPGQERGTLPYASPEVARGQRAASQADDVYALAATLAFALLGRPPLRVRGTTRMLLAVSEHGLDVAALQQLAGKRAQLAQVLVRALAFAAPERLSRAAEVLAELAPE